MQRKSLVDLFQGLHCRGDDTDIVETATGKFISKLTISRTFFGAIIGTQGAVLRRIQDATNTRLFIPRQHQHGDIVVIGNCRGDVVLARKHVAHTVVAARNRLSFTHFLSLPLASQEIKDNFVKFQEKVLELCPHLKEKLFVPPETLHATLQLLVLTDTRERRQACQKLEQLCNLLRSLLMGKELRVEARGLDYFSEDPSAVRVLYAKVYNPLLQEVAETVSKQFRQTGLTKSWNDALKLHMTLMKVHCSVNLGKEAFDARPILEAFDGFYFGTLTVQKLHLSVIGTGGRGIDGFYLSPVYIHLPSFTPIRSPTYSGCT